MAGVQAAEPFALAAALSPVTKQQLGELSLDEAKCVVAETQRVINAVSVRQVVAVVTFAARAEERYDRTRPTGRRAGVLRRPPTVTRASPAQELLGRFGRSSAANAICTAISATSTIQTAGKLPVTSRTAPIANGPNEASV